MKKKYYSGIFAFDGPMYKDSNGIYCNTTITNEMLDRYFKVVDKLYVIIRTYTLDQTYEKANLIKLELENRIEIIEVPNLNSPITYFTKGRYKELFKSIVVKSDLVFLRIPSIISDIVASICLELNKPYLVEVGGCSWDSFFNHGILGKMVAPVMYVNQRKTVSNASFASFVTEKWLQKRYPAKKSLKVITSSNVYLKEFNDAVVEKKISKLKDLRYEEFKIGTLASVDVRYKGQEYIIRALGQLKKEGYYLKYELVGAGSGRYLRNLAKKCRVEDQVQFLGLKKHEDVWAWLDSIYIYAQPSKQEGLPRAMIEAMNRGCICIGSSTAGIPELLDESYIFNNGDVKEICRIIKKILINKSFMQNTIRENYKKSHDFAADILSEKRTDLFLSYKTFIINRYKHEKIAQ